VAAGQTGGHPPISESPVGVGWEWAADLPSEGTQGEGEVEAPLLLGTAEAWLPQSSTHVDGP
jgi:hypothetical protein